MNKLFKSFTSVITKGKGIKTEVLELWLSQFITSANISGKAERHEEFGYCFYPENNSFTVLE